MNKLLKLLKDCSFDNTVYKNSYYQVLSDLQDKIHAQIPDQIFDMSQVASTEIRGEYFNGTYLKRAVIFLRTNGCEWAVQQGHGCTMCGHIAKQQFRNRTLSNDTVIEQFTNCLEQINFEDIPVLNLYNNGSFLNENEISAYARNEILNKIKAIDEIKYVVIESRPEFITENKILEIKNILGNKHVEIALGLELKNDLYRIFCLNKGFTLQIFDKAAKIITKHLNLKVYVFLKPILLTENESINETIETIDYAFKIGCSTVSLEACTIQDYTLTKLLYDNNLYKPPWLWSIIEVIKRCHNKGKLIVGMFQFYPSPSKVPFNCNKCSQQVIESIDYYNKTLDINRINSLSCKCKEEWENEKKQKTEPFFERLNKLNELELTF